MDHTSNTGNIDSKNDIDFSSQENYINNKEHYLDLEPKTINNLSDKKKEKEKTLLDNNTNYKDLSCNNINNYSDLISEFRDKLDRAFADNNENKKIIDKNKNTLLGMDINKNEMIKKMEKSNDNICQFFFIVFLGVVTPTGF